MTNRELDEWIAENVMGWKESKHAHWWIFPEGGQRDRLWFKPTELISDAVQVVDKMKKLYPDWYFELLWFPEGGITFTIFESAEGHIIHACEEADTESLAICLAANKVIEGA